jgi:hypothetical protein
MAKIIPIVSGDAALGAARHGARHVETRARLRLSRIDEIAQRRQRVARIARGASALLADPLGSFLKADAPEAMTRGAIGRPLR